MRRGPHCAGSAPPPPRTGEPGGGGQRAPSAHAPSPANRRKTPPPSGARPRMHTLIQGVTSRKQTRSADIWVSVFSAHCLLALGVFVFVPCNLDGSVALMMRHCGVGQHHDLMSHDHDTNVI